jgi:hypothetical protein
MHTLWHGCMCMCATGSLLRTSHQRHKHDCRSSLRQGKRMLASNQSSQQHTQHKAGQLSSTGDKGCCKILALVDCK